jgi:metal-responsive CopG/Arc/MetJ family transcriptional regulator
METTMDNGALKMAAKRHKKPLIALHMSPTLIEAVDTLAERQFRSRAEVIRQSIIKELELHGLCPVAA